MLKKYLLIILVLTFGPFTYALGANLDIQSLSPSSTVYSGNQVVIIVAPSGFNGTINYSVSDSFSGSSVSSSNINGGGVFGWVPSNSDSGYHNITITATDNDNTSVNVTQGITVIGPGTLTVQNLAPGSSVNVGQTVYFNAIQSGFTNPTYTISDSLISSSVTSASMNSYGSFSWTPKVQDVGGHSLTITVSDNSGRSASAIQSITVGQATASIQNLSPGTSALAKQNVTFKVVPTGFTNPTYTVFDSLFGSSVSSNSIDSNGNFSWTPGTNELGQHTITININDSTGNSSQVTQIITVGTGTLALSGFTSGNTVDALSPVTFTASTTGFTNPTYSVSDSFSGTTITNINISSSGIFAWIPQNSDSGMHSINVYATDGSGNSATKNIVVNVRSKNISSTNTISPVSSSNKYQFNNNLSLGSTGTDVTELQKFLIQQGLLTGSATGYFGSLTENAVKKFQTANGISPVGNVGPATRGALNGTTPVLNVNTSTTKYTFTKPLAVGSTGIEVTELQKKLTSLGIYSGPITGTFGPLTETAVKKLQAKYNLSQLGSVGPGTRALLNSL